MKLVHTRRKMKWLGCIFFATGLTFHAAAQSLEPRAYANTPVGMNFALIGYAHTEGSVTTDASSPIQDAKVQTDSALLGYSRSFGLLGTSSKIAFVEGESWVSGEAKLSGQPRSRFVTGLIDPTVRGSINLYGAPALTMSEFTNYQQNLIIGTSLSVTAPLGQYDSSKLLNIGQNWRPGQRVSVELPLQNDVEQRVLPWSAVVQDIHGGHWVYEQIQEHTFVRRRVQIQRVTDSWAVMDQGPPVGTIVVITGVAEIFGTEFGFGK